jgi:type III pantothenate kinase
MGFDSMLLCVDIGNTSTVVGGFPDCNSGELHFQCRFASSIARTVDEYQVLLMGSLQHHVARLGSIDRVIVASVVPQLTGVFVELVRRCFDLEAELVGPGVKTGLAINVSDPSALGADRVANAVALKLLYGYPGVAIDFGTATCFDYINASGCYQGSIIAPGVERSLESLVSSTAKLPRIELNWPKSVVGKGTVSAMQAGAMVGYACLVDGLVDRLTSEVGELKHIVATGELAQTFMQHCSRIKDFDGDLTLQGLRLIAKVNQES